MTPLSRWDERYHNDMAFRAMVDSLSYAIDTLQLTPSEVREAAMYACIRYEERRGADFLITFFTDHELKLERRK